MSSTKNVSAAALALSPSLPSFSAQAKCSALLNLDLKTFECSSMFSKAFFFFKVADKTLTSMLGSGSGGKSKTTEVIIVSGPRKSSVGVAAAKPIPAKNKINKGSKSFFIQLTSLKLLLLRLKRKPIQVLVFQRLIKQLFQFQFRCL